MSETAEQLVLWLIPLAPLVAATVIALLGPGVLKERSHVPCWAALGVSAICSLLLMFVVLPAHFSNPSAAEAFASGYDWLSVGSLHIPIELHADAMSAIMLVMVTSVSFLVAVFAAGYMHHDPGYPRFFAAVSLFVFSMCMLVLAGNFVQLFVFWEAVGLCSYLLIGFWFRKPSAAAAAKKAFVVNRIGDFGLIMAILLIWTTFGSLEFADVLHNHSRLVDLAQANPGLVTLICLCLFLGAVGKSAQFPLQVWLPDAMEGPTPVSALIHAATMVTAGVYLTARCLPLFSHSETAQLVVSGTGATTAFIAAFIGLTQFDLKRVLAYSTVSQLGFLFMVLGAGAAGPELPTHAATAAMFHLFTHAYFKALLFLSAGSVMHSMGDIIDMRRFSGLKNVLPITHWTFLCGAAALAGVPLLSGFWSKDEILVTLSHASHSKTVGTFFTVIFWLAVVTATLTAFYTFRAYFMTFWGPEKFPEEAGHHPHDAPPVMAWPLRILAICALFIGLILGPTHLFGGYLQHTPGIEHADAPHLNFAMMGLSLIIAGLGIGTAWVCYVQSPGIPAKVSAILKPLAVLSYNKCYLDEIFYGLLVLPLAIIAQLCAVLDFGLLDQIVNLFGRIPRWVSAIPRGLHSGLTPNYALLMWTGVIVCLAVMLGMK